MCKALYFKGFLRARLDNVSYAGTTPFYKSPALLPRRRVSRFLRLIHIALFAS